MLFLAVLVLLGDRGSDAEFTVQCSDNSEASVTVEGTDVSARYKVTYCAAAHPTPLQWDLLLNTVNEPADNCSYEKLKETRAGTSHSASVELIDPALNVTCPIVCFSKLMDLMFGSCYRLESKLVRQGPRKPIHSEPYNTYYYADNNITRFTRDNLQYIKCTDYDDRVVCNWFEGLIPITDYEIFMWPNSSHYTCGTSYFGMARTWNGLYPAVDDYGLLMNRSATGEPISAYERYVRLPTCGTAVVNKEESTDVTGNCTRVESPGRAVQCSLQVSPGCYVLQLRHTAPWTKGFRNLSIHDAATCYAPPSPPRITPPVSTGLYWVTGALVCVGAALLGALGVYHTRLRAKTRLRVFSEWLRSRPPPPPLVPESPLSSGPVLLLYARDCARIATALKHWMQLHGNGKIYDLYSTEVMSLAAPAPGAWVRGCITAPHVRVVLLQSPALAALHATVLGERTPTRTDTLKLEEPLLPRRAVYRSPHYGDTLLQYAAQLLGEIAHTQPFPPYTKYCLATISQVPVDVFPALVPYTRFELPHAAPALLNTLWPQVPVTNTGLEPLSEATEQFVQLVRDNPNYLADELLFV